MYQGRVYSSDDFLNYIKEYQGKHGGNSPTFAIIQHCLGVSSKSVVRFYLDKLVEEGKIKYLMTSGSRPKVRGIIVNQLGKQPHA